MPTEYGSPIYAGHRPKADASLVALIRRAGGTLIGKTVTTEFAHLDPGKTRNPHNPAHTPGGSSSGSAAGVAAGFFPIATGSQTGGSVIRPASYCGVAGFKPSYRLLPTVGMKCVSWHLDTAGLFAAVVADVAFAAAAISGRDLRVDGRTPASPRIGVLREQPWPRGQRRHERRGRHTPRARPPPPTRGSATSSSPPVLAERVPGARAPSKPTRRRARSPPNTSRHSDKLAKGVLRAGRERLCDQRRRLRRRAAHRQPGAPRARRS